jgi:uncharacterized protein involved in high-affinity Fe2+ transport
MKCHPGWLAAGLVLFAILACSIGNTNDSNNSNSNSNTNQSASTADIHIDKIHMAKDQNGEPGESAKTFDPADRTIHCVITLNKAKAGTAIKFVWIMADVEGSKNEQIKSIDYTTKALEDNVHGHLMLQKDWPKGSYRVEVYINGVLDKTIDYTVE